MSSPQIEIQIIAALVAMACSLLGVFLVLRKTALISDAISHSILPGIVVGFFITEDLNSPFLILMAALTGMLTVLLIEWIQNTKLVGEDTSIGIVFPALFSLGIILIVRNAGDVHLDTDAVLLGELAFAPFDRYFINGVDYGPKAIWIMGGILLIIVTSLILFFKELDVDMNGIGPFIPNEDTPLKDAEGGQFELALKVMAIVRLLLPDINIPATTAMETLNKQGRVIALQCGANVVMPNVTEGEYRKLYALYPGKICTGDTPAHCRGCISGKIRGIGRIVSDGPGFRANGFKPKTRQ